MTDTTWRKKSIKFCLSINSNFADNKIKLNQRIYLLLVLENITDVCTMQDYLSHHFTFKKLLLVTDLIVFTVYQTL